MTSDEAKEFIKAAGLTEPELARLSNKNVEFIQQCIRDGQFPSDVIAAIEVLHSNSNRAQGDAPDASVDAPALSDSLFDNENFAFDTTIGLAHPMIPDADIENMLFDYGPTNPDDGVPYAALVFPTGKNFIAVAPKDGAVRKMISDYISTSTVTAMMSPLLRLEAFAKNPIHLPITHGRLTFVVSSYGKWIAPKKLFSFSEAIVSICPRDAFRPGLVDNDIAVFEQLLRDRVKRATG